MLDVLRPAILIVLFVVTACGDSPTRPGPVTPSPPPAPPPPPTNVAPSITAIAVQGNRRNEPPNFADLSESVAVTATVTDQETAVDQLQYNWTATLGTFSGTGLRVTWQAPAAAVTPAVVTLTLEVVERYGSGLEHRVTRTTEVALHNSAKEVGDMARQFLLDFSDSSLRDVPQIMRNFSDDTKTCRDGKEAEASQVAQNRIDYRITQFSVGAPVVTLDFDGRCPFRSRAADACAQVPVSWTSVRLTTGPPGTTPVGAIERVSGTDQVTAIYIRNQRRWGLCESDFDGIQRLGSTFIR